MTPEELERRAYADGDIDTAALLGKQADLERRLSLSVQEVRDLEEKLADLRLRLRYGLASPNP